MNGVEAPIARDDPSARYVARIEAHLGRFAAGHDPIGHLFAIERLARATRSELRATRARPCQEQRPW